MTHVLLIDDDELIRRTLIRILTANGFLVTAAADGREGLRVFREQQPDLVITDIFMPEIEGIEVILRLRKLCRNLPILAISGSSWPGGGGPLALADKLGATGLLAKPFGADELLAGIAKVLPARAVSADAAVPGARRGSARASLHRANSEIR